MYIVDIHIHARDFNQRSKETIDHALKVARKAGVSAVLAMPNTDPTLSSEVEVLDYKNIAEQSSVKDVYFGVYAAVTKNPEQIRTAVKMTEKYPDFVKGLKLYAGHSTGNIGVIDIREQYLVFDTLARTGYKGILAIHAEKESRMNNLLFDRKNPVTHATLARPTEAEEESIRDMVAIAQQTNYKGKLHFVHISSSKSVELLQKAKREGLDISSGVCPHHLVYDWNNMKEKDGLLLKMNPPLRAPGENNLMLEHLREGRIDLIETDHAPHTLKDKLGENEKKECASGLPALHAWPLVVSYLELKGFTRNRIEEVVGKRAAERFNLPIGGFKQLRGVYDPTAYPFNVWRPLEEMVIRN
ncbi:MAG: dihydroorotase family protein [Nanoarchaeota archaeon]|nr:dihydroorotase family protein [Nanoarchaeota archaeon]